MKKILFVIPTLDGGGAEQVLINLVNHLDKSKFDITVFSIFNIGINRQYLDENIKYKYFSNVMIRGNIHIMKLFSPRLLYRLMINEEFDIVVSYLEGPASRIVSGCPFKDSKLLNWVHTEINDISILLPSFRSKKELIECYKKYDRTIFVSETAKSAYSKTFEELSETNKRVIYNTINTIEVKTKAEESITDVHFDEQKFNIVSVGRFIKEKGYERLINIIKRLVLDGFPIHLYLLGKGELESKYQAQINQLNLTENITIIGFKENPYKYIKKSHLFVCSSYREGFSTAVSEALIVGVPVVSTSCSGMVEILGDNSEYGIITQNDEKKLYIGIKKILDDSNLRKYYKRKAVERGNSFNLSATVRSVEQLFQEVME